MVEPRSYAGGRGNSWPPSGRLTDLLRTQFSDEVPSRRQTAWSRAGRRAGLRGEEYVCVASAVASTAVVDARHEAGTGTFRDQR